MNVLCTYVRIAHATGGGPARVAKPRASADATESRARPALQSLERAIDVLESFTTERPEWGVSELSRRLGLERTIVSRIAGTLANRGLLVRVGPHSRYRLGARLATIGMRVTIYDKVREVAAPILEKLSDQAGETVNLSVLDGSAEIDIDRFIPKNRRMLTVGPSPLRVVPCHCTATGKVLLAYLPGAERDAILSQGLEAFTEHTIVDPEVLRRQLDDIRLCGLALVEEELEVGLSAVATPIFDRDGGVQYACGIAGPTRRLSGEALRQSTAWLLAGAACISQNLGYMPEGAKRYHSAQID
jgi:DNA-binding IclR family transcriptional regulator